LNNARALIEVSGGVRCKELIRSETGTVHRGFRAVSARGLSRALVSSVLGVLGIGLPAQLANRADFSRLDVLSGGAGLRAVVAARDEGGDLAVEIAYELWPDERSSTWTLLELPAVRLESVVRWIERLGAEVSPARIRFLLDLFPLCGNARYPHGSLSLILRRSASADKVVCGLQLDTARLAANLPASTSAARQLLDLDAPEDRVAKDLTAAVFESSNEVSWTRGVASPALVETRSMERSLLDGIRAIAARCRENHWRDYLLPAGESNAWVTAWALYHLSDPALPAYEELREVWGAAAGWLKTHRSSGGGWGYSTGASSDADSTSLAILGLRRVGIEIPSEAVGFLERCLTPDGPATYPPMDGELSGWTSPTVEVLPFSIAALGSQAWTPDRSIDWLRARQLENGLWPPYWWVSPLYATWMALQTIGTRHDLPRRETLARTLSRYEARGAFENALLLLCLCEPALGGGRDERERAIAHVLQEQTESGIWPGTALMRLPHRHLTEPWKEIDPGATYRDLRGVFTSVTAVAALQAALNSC
jgi:hypothetical protein